MLGYRVLFHIFKGQRSTDLHSVLQKPVLQSGRVIQVQICPEDLFPLRSVGTMVCNKNIDNFHNESEQIAFAPGVTPPGESVVWVPGQACLVIGAPFIYRSSLEHVECMLHVCCAALGFVLRA